MMRCTTLNRPQSSPLMGRGVAFLKFKDWDLKYGRAQMVDALQINVALWGMIGCAAFKSLQFAQYLNWLSKQPLAISAAAQVNAESDPSIAMVVAVK
jgi:hypothetical protein